MQINFEFHVCCDLIFVIYNGSILTLKNYLNMKEEWGLDLIQFLSVFLIFDAAVGTVILVVIQVFQR